ncbi:CDP-glucose 4,6-dehydratase [Granulosicoccus antarcticus IMCC3135]|uniref:CDP-glucose 4,6-dehydratase n=2 Tax=Granulosicoccus TaxID=437504 RepID=A0A2Z2NZE2_9GAMM|nr:CDP-glucose 4,6-dehydratase [Granulosicoccus antarcticus IMCC3135]
MASALNDNRMNTTFWKGRRVLLTGHTGFKGSWLALWLNSMGANVHGYALAPDTDPSLYELARIDDLVESCIGDIRDRDSLEAAVQAAQPEIVLHLAAQPLVRESFKDPVTTFDTNVMGTINVLEAVRRCESVKAVLVVTTDKCYQNREWDWGYRENEALGGHDPYSASKACTELVAQSWRLSFMGATGEDARHCAVATARAGNVIGGGDWAKDRLIPDLLNSIANNKDVVLRNPNAIRPWQHVLEPLAGYLMLAEKLYTEGEPWTQAWNFGPHDADARSVSWIVEQLIRECESSAGWQLESAAQPHEAQHLKLDCSKARQQLGWNPVWNLEHCLKEIARWHSAWKDGADMQQESLETIQRFSKL